MYDSFIQRPAIEIKNEFVYTAGYSGYDFFDLSRLTLSPKTSQNVVSIYEELLRDLDGKGTKFNKLAFIERTIGPMMISSELARRMDLECIVIKSRIPCSCKLCSKLRIKGSIEPPISSEDRVVIVSDVLTTGGTILGAIDLIEENGAKVVAAIAILDRQVPEDKATKKRTILNRGIKLLSYVKRDRLLALGFARPSSDDLVQEDLLEILRNAIDLSDEEADLAKNYFDSLAQEILENKKDVDEKSKKIVKNMLISLLVNSRVGALEAMNTEVT